MIFFFLFGIVEISKAENSSREDIIDLSGPVKAEIGEIEFRDCRVSAQGRERKLQCAWYEVAENPKMPEGKKIKLFVVRIPAKRHVKNVNDPVLFLSGGPGQAASETFLFADHMWPALAKKRDFYLIDQRGTGYSNHMGCDETLQDQELGVTEYDSTRVQKLARECLASLPGDVRYYTTDISVRDFENVRMALDIDNWNLLGVSYGTRVATHYIRSAPDSLRTVVLDSAVPPEHVLGSEIAMRSQQVLDILYQRCEQSAECTERMPGLRENVETLLNKLEESSVTIAVENLRSGETEDITFTREHLVTLIRIYLYNPHTLAVLPPMLHEAATKENYSPLARAAINTSDYLKISVSDGLEYSVICTEEYPYFDSISDQKMEENRASYMNANVIRVLNDICSVWPRGDAPENMKTSLKSDIPVLLVSGEYDPATPPAYAEQARKYFTRSKHFVLKGQGHMVSGAGCMPHLIAKFVAEQSTERLNTKCLDRLSAAPLFLNFNGPALQAASQ